MPAGRPRLISSPEEFEARACTYFEECRTEEKRPKLTELILAVGLSSRESLDEYGRRAEFSDSVKWAKLVIESGYERRLDDAACVGAIFGLKNMGWSDRQEIAHELSGDGWSALMRDIRARKRGNSAGSEGGEDAG